MSATLDTNTPRPDPRWRLLVWGAAAGLLLLPAVAMQFTDEVDWDETDFIVFGAMLAFACGAWEVAMRLSRNAWYRAGAAVAVLASFLLVWANLAVGFIGDEDNPLNLMYFGVIGIALLGGFVARFRAPGLFVVMVVVAVAQLVAGVIGFPVDPRSGPPTLVWTAMWLASALMFRRAAKQGG
jgi:hypothetical protein